MASQLGRRPGLLRVRWRGHLTGLERRICPGPGRRREVEFQYRLANEARSIAGH